LKSTYRKILIIILISFFTASIIPYVLGKSRRGYLTDFIYSNEIRGVGFKNTVQADEKIAPEATAYALEILDFYGRSPHDIDDLTASLNEEIIDMFNDDEVSLYDLTYILKALSTIGFQIDDVLTSRIYKYLNTTEQSGGGFSLSNTTTSISISSTYHIYQIYSLIEKPFPNATIHKNWILSSNNSDGGYGGNKSLPSTLLNTFYVVSLLDSLSSIDELVDKNQTLTYLNSSYISISSDVNNYGGYLPDSIATYSLLSSTFYSVIAKSLIDSSWLNNGPTSKWVLSRQNFQDGGFVDITEGYQQFSSSVMTSFYAFNTLKTFDSALKQLSGEIWMVEFDYMILIIILVSIGLIVGIGVFFWRRRRI
jgi:hypothetical protein